MPRRKAKSKRGKDSRNKRGTKNYEYANRNVKKRDDTIFERKIRARYFKTREETREEKTEASAIPGRTRRSRKLVSPLIPTCKKEKSRVRRAFFGYLVSGKSSLPKKKTHNNRLTKRRCR
jgi:hypothetical protein